MTDTQPTTPVPASVERVLKQFRLLGREEKMQALVSWSRNLEPLPERFRDDVLSFGKIEIRDCYGFDTRRVVNQIKGRTQSHAART